MPIIKSFAELGPALVRARIKAGLLHVEKGDHWEASIILFEQKELRIPEELQATIAESFYQASKVALKDGMTDYCIKLLGESVRLDRTHKLAKLKRNSLVNRNKEQVPREIVVKGKRHLVTQEAIRQVELEEFRKKMKIPCLKSSCVNPAGPSELNCAECRGLLSKARNDLPEQLSLDGFYSSGVYRWQGDTRSSETYTQIIREFKDGGKYLGKHLSALLADSLTKRSSVGSEIDLITYVPENIKRTRERGYHPPEILARELSKRLCVPQMQALKRIGDQRARNASQEDIRKQYVCKKAIPEFIKGRIVLLVDDIATTGKTLVSCATLLKEIGAKKVYAVTLALSETSHRQRRKEILNLSKLALRHHVTSAKHISPAPFRALFDNLEDNIERVFGTIDNSLVEMTGITKQALAALCDREMNTPDDSQYPPVFRSPFCHPILFYIGAIYKFLDYRDSIAVVGVQAAITWSIESAKKVSTTMSQEGWVVFSWFLNDTSSHLCNFDSSGYTVAILGCGPEANYHRQTKKIYQRIAVSGVIISELPFGTKIKGWNLKKQNTTIVEAAKGVLVTQSPKMDSVMYAFNIAEKQGKWVFMLKDEEYIF